MSHFVSRGFRGRPRTPEGRLPPGQYAESGFPVLTAGPTPQVEPGEWRFRIDGIAAGFPAASIRTERFGPTS